MMDSSAAGRFAHRVLILVLYIFLLAPVFPVVMMSFTDDPYIMFPPHSWGVRWYVALWHNYAFQSAMERSVTIGVIATVIAMAVSLSASYAITRLPLIGRDVLLALFTAPLIVPAIVIGLGLLLALVRLGLLGTYVGLIASHSMLIMPYAIRIIVTAFSTLPADVEEAGSTLGATPFGVFRRVTFPLLAPAIFGAAGLCFLVSFDEVAVTMFIVGTRISTLPVALFRYTQDHTDPSIAALSVVLIAISAAVIVALERSIGLMRAIGRQ